MMEKPLDRHRFYSGLMLALAAHQESIPRGQRFYRAFYTTVQLAITAQNKKFAIEDAEWVAFDPVFGRVSQADEMLAEATRDRLISVDDAGRACRFRISAREAETELQRLPGHDWFMNLGKEFSQLLSSDV